jgi:hypothetical protein
MKARTNIRRSIRAVSPVISVLLMIAIAVAASLIAFAWIMGYMGRTTTEAGKAILIQSMGLNPDNENYLRVYVQNVGQSTVEFDPASCVYINDVRGTLTDFGTDGININPLPVGQTAAIEVDLSILGLSTDMIKVKVVTKDGTFSETSEAISVSGLPGTYTVTVGAAPPAAVSAGCTASAVTPGPYTLGMKVYVTSSAASGWSLQSWSVTISTDGGGDYFTVTGDMTVTATFTAILPDYVDTNNAVHDTNVGSHSNFANMKNEGGFDTLTEANVGGGTASWTTPAAIYDKCGESQTGYPSTWHYAIYTIDGDLGTYWRHDDDHAHWIVFDMGQSVTVTQVRIYQDHDSDDRWPVGDGNARVDVYVSDNPTIWGTVVLDNWDANNGEGWQASGTFSATGRYIRLETTSDSGDAEHARMYEFEAKVTPPANYQLDLEVQFTGDVSAYSQLQIATGTLDTENLEVYYWSTTSSSWQLLDTLTTSSNTYTYDVSTLTGWTTHELRFYDTSRTSDTTPSSWQIYYVRLVA